MEEEKKVLEINPNKCYFVATYPDGRILKGNALSQDAWGQVPSGISGLRYELSNGDSITIPQHKAYAQTVDFEDGTYYAIEVKGLLDREIVVHRINLRQVPGSGLKIGDVVIGNMPAPEEVDKSWKFSE